ncbi:ABC transporter ATP-binding protein [Aquibaculum sediminis]|uniref:ABC transporter ATP-binding protein n=1 Tax=Aquibaculum sediminis TaxID=3231907 RepID=UPI0034528041
MAQADRLLSVQNIHTYYADSYVLQGLSLDLHEGQIVSILGRNGMGKTTLVRSIAGLTPPRQGDILLRGTSLLGLPSYEVTRRGIALVPQGRRIFKSLSVRENLLLPTSTMAAGSRTGTAKGGAQWDQEQVLNQFPQLRERTENLGTALSGGEQQMLAIGRALMSNPDIILMDEPSEGLAPRIIQQVGEIMLDLKKRNHAILLVEQNLGLALAVSDYIYVLSVGRFVFEGTPAELSENPTILDRHLGVSGKQALS